MAANKDEGIADEVVDQLLAGRGVENIFAHLGEDRSQQVSVYAADQQRADNLGSAPIQALRADPWTARNA